MPRIGEPIVRPTEPTKERKVSNVVPYGRVRYICPVCKAIHWFRFVQGCRNPKCKFKGSLEVRE